MAQPTKVLITPEMIAEAKERAYKMENNTDYDIKEQHDLDEPNRYYVGQLGELAFRKILDNRNKKYQHFSIGTKADKYDFKVPLVNTDNTVTMATIDVKTGSKPEYRYLGSLATQKLKCDLYVGALINGDCVDIWGFAKRNQLKPVMLKKMNNAILLTETMDIDRLVSKIL